MTALQNKLEPSHKIERRGNEGKVCGIASNDFEPAFKFSSIKKMFLVRIIFMGADAEVYTFDYARYSTEVVPAFRRFLLDGKPPVWMEELIHAMDIEVTLRSYVDLARYCDYFDESMAWLGQYESSDLSSGWEIRACPSPGCPERFRCPFHKNQQSGDTEELLKLFETIVADRCLGSSQFLGRSVNVKYYGALLNSLGATDELMNLMLRLGRRGFVIGYQWCNSDGIHGWLNPAETRLLYSLLDSLPLPKYEASFEAMKKFGRQKPGAYVHPDASFEELSLSFVRTVASIASSEDKGILWGNDVIVPKEFLQTMAELSKSQS